MNRISKWLTWSVLGLLLAAAALLAHTWFFKPVSINWFYNRVFVQFTKENPELLTQLRLLEQVGIRSHNAELTDASTAHEDRQFALLKASQATLHRYDASHYTEQDRISYEVFDYFIATQVRGEAWRYHGYPVNQLFGIQSQLPNLMTQTQQVNDATDAEHFIARLGQFPRKLAQVTEGIKLRQARGIVPPKFVVEKVLDQIQGFVGTDATANPIAIGFKEKLDKIPADKMDGATRSALQARVEAAVQNQVLPAYRSLAQHFETLRPKATRNDGVWALPDGDKFYQYAIESNTTTKMTADQIHTLGLAEVARIGAEMDQILTGAGYTQASRAQRMHTLAKAPDQLYSDDAAGRAQILKDYQTIIDEITAGLAPHFNIQAKSKVEVKRVPEFTEKTAPGAYYNEAPMDGSKPGTFFANLRDVSETPRYGMRTLAYHEAVPGHHMQIAIAQEQKGLPLFRSVVPFTAYMEGWALYAERLAWEMGYQKNPLDNLGRLQAEMFRAVRLVVDTGMHSKRWTREQAIDYMVANTGMPEAEVVTEIERYLVDPGQALAYKVGMLKILELRERAKTALGAKFKLSDFHDEVLKNGAMPLQVLERVIDEYIARAKAT
ncbi:DUF885 domain-containing protein [Rhodoferax sp.]|uniref:DUF885 domain-containing protein n=1 Tax=Rhodoferax sp. TaxID=50421 RepID=UPI002744FBD9|nr:DUF885 domain-containing protein [Rhodoferax sp.]